MSRITLLDGVVEQELVRRSGDRPTPFWSTQVMVDHPGPAQAVHSDYFAVGATIATTNSYAFRHDRQADNPLKGHLQILMDLFIGKLPCRAVDRDYSFSR
jgi:S-methylmethionine-dependent homocysteine/selenocysteine methylase